MNCSNKENCTAIELARMQWGESKVTLNMPLLEKNYTPPVLSITGWGIFPTPGAPIQPEFYYYSETFYDYPIKLDMTQCKKILNTNVQEVGLNNAYNAARLVTSVETNNR